MLTFRLSNVLKQKKSLPLHVIEAGGGALRFYPRQYEQRGCAVELLMRLNGGEWLVIGVIAQEDLQQVIMLLQEGLAWTNERAEMPRQLQTTWLSGATYYVDERLRELRKKDDPSDRIGLSMS